jgi:proline dehydrogenase
MSILDSLIAATLPIVPKPIVRVFSRRYIAGESVAEMVKAVKELNAEGALCTVDVLGEFTTDLSQCDATVEEYLRALDAIVREKLECNLSIKLTAFGLSIDPAACRRNVRRLLDAARERGIFVRFDMEDSPYTSATLELYREMQREYPAVGPVIQAYMRRTLADVRGLLADPGPQPLNVRLCKGIYREKPDVTFQDREVVRRSYANVLELLLERGAHVGIATHDEVLIYEGLRLVDRLGIARDRYEFQMLFGVIPEMRRRLISEGHRLRVYVPFGREWYGYSLRRLRENPQIAGYVLKGMLRRT